MVAERRIRFTEEEEELGKYGEERSNEINVIANKDEPNDPESK